MLIDLRCVDQPPKNDATLMVMPLTGGVPALTTTGTCKLKK